MLDGDLLIKQKLYPATHAFSSDKFVADNLEAADTDESAAAQLATTLRD